MASATATLIQSIQEEIPRTLEAPIFLNYSSFVDLLKKNFLENDPFSTMISSQQEEAIKNFYIQLLTYVAMVKTQLETSASSTTNTNSATSTVDCIKEKLLNNLEEIYSALTDKEKEEAAKLHSQYKHFLNFAKVNAGALFFTLGLFIGFFFSSSPLAFFLSLSFACVFAILGLISHIAAEKYENAYSDLTYKPIDNIPDYQQKKQKLQSLLKLTSSEPLSTNQQRPASPSVVFTPPTTTFFATLPQPPSVTTSQHQHHHSRSLSF